MTKRGKKAMQRGIEASRNWRKLARINEELRKVARKTNTFFLVAQQQGPAAGSHQILPQDGLIIIDHLSLLK